MMKLSSEENPTRNKILLLLKKNEKMTVAEMGQEMGITHMAVRQHLLYLERKGNIHYTVKKFGVGRPVFQYSLTEKANEIFPKAYGTFTSDVLRAIVDLDGRKKLEKILKVRKDYLLAEKAELISKCRNFPERVSRLARHLDNKGYMVEVEETNGAYHLRKFNCLLPWVAKEFPETCDLELELYQNLLGEGVRRNKCLSKGEISCEYLIPYRGARAKKRRTRKKTLKSAR